MTVRRVDVVVVSDIHLGTYASRAREFTAYLKSVDPRLLILNGDIVDAWQFSKRYFPSDHLSAIREIFSKLSNGTRVIYVTGNHDDIMRRYSDLEIGKFLLTDKIAFEINGNRTWIFHGDVFDRTTTGQAKFWGKLGSNGYAVLLAFNRLANLILHFFGQEKLSLSKSVMRQFNKRIIKVDSYEKKIAELAIEKNFDTVICGHIHQPQKKIFTNEKGSTCYLNAGDWMEHMTALEFYGNEWHLYTYDAKELKVVKPEREKREPVITTTEIAFYLNSLTT